MADATYQPKVYKSDGGDKLNVVSGGTLNVESGATETHANNPTFSGNPAFTGAPTGVVVAKTVTFTEDATSTTHTGSVTVPAGATILDIQVTNSVLWTGGTATMKVGDAADDDGYFTGIDLKATDLLVGEVLSAMHGDLWGGKNGAYLVAATGRRGPTSTNFGNYQAAGAVITGVVTVGTPATTAGRTFMTVFYAVGAVTAATPA